jgi:NitT/TauT family transport system substrate-binding protein
MKILYTLSISLIILLTLSGCGGEQNNENDAKAKKIKIVLNWFPEAEHGGYYEALVNKGYEKENLDVEILSGGPNVPVLQQVIMNRVDYAVVNADDVLNAVEGGADLVTIYAPLQTNPRCIMVHAESNIKQISEIKNMKLAMSSRPSFRHWLVAKYKFENVHIVPYPPNISVFLKDKNFAQQAYNIAEPCTARMNGANPRVLMVSDLGFNPYSSVLVTTRKRFNENPEQIAAIVRASIKGWSDYVAAPEKCNAYIHTLNPEMPMEILKFGAGELKKMIVPLEKNVPANGMIYERWQKLAEQMKEAKLVDLNEKKIRSAFHSGKG